VKPHGRPKKYRIVRIDPRISQFSPRGRPGRPDEVSMPVDEFYRNNADPITLFQNGDYEILPEQEI